MKHCIFTYLAIFTTIAASAQSYDTKFARPLSEVIKNIEARFGVRLKCSDVDTTGIILNYADFRIRPYSLEETLQNVLAPFDFKAVKQNDKLYKVKNYEYARRTPADGQKLTDYLLTLSPDSASWEARRAQLKKEVRDILNIDALLAQCSTEAPQVSKIRKHNGYTTQNFCMHTLNGHTVKGTIYAPSSKGKHPLIVCPNGHFLNGRYGKVQQLRLGTLARMGAICISYDLWGWGESADEVGAAAHRTDTAHVMQAINGLKILDWAYKFKNVDTERVAVNGGSGGGSQCVLLALLDDRFTAACPVVSVSSWFDGGCPCESGKPIQLACGGTCNAELMATFAPRPLMLVSDGGDWTSTTPEVEYPFIQHFYKYYDAEQNVTNIHLPNERHDFGENKRNAVYTFFGNVFHLDTSKVDESLVDIESEDVLRWNAKRE